ncbi:MAG: glycosyltransferase, partial [Candidatus Tectomicrobia bacterium]|nr:glycosyltransferase [Candidatus Tectomicrobia bacterium]
GRPIRYQGVPAIFFARQWHEGFKYSRHLAHWLQRNVSQFDIVHIAAVFSHASLAAARACQQHALPYIVRPLGTLAPWSLRQKRVRKRLLWSLAVKQMLQQASAIHYTTLEERRQVEEALGLRHGVVIPLGVDEDVLTSPVVSQRFRQHYPALGQHPYILVLSRLHPTKRIDRLLHVFLDLVAQAEFQGWRLVVAGDGEDRYVHYLRQLIQERGGETSVLFTGWLDGPMKIAALREAALLAQLSQQENFGLSVAEALACGTPVLISTHVNLADEIRAARAGWVVSLQYHAVRQTLEDILRQENERTARGRAGQELIRSRFRWDNVARELIQLYRMLTHQS